MKFNRSMGLVVLLLGGLSHFKIKNMSFDLKNAARQGNLEKVKELIGREIDLKDREGQTLLMIAAQAGQLDIVEYLVTSGANTNAQDKYGITPLMKAAQASHLNIVEHLIKNGADINAKNKYGMTVFMYATNPAIREYLDQAHSE